MKSCGKIGFAFALVLLDGCGGSCSEDEVVPELARMRIKYFYLVVESRHW